MHETWAQEASSASAISVALDGSAVFVVDSGRALVLSIILLHRSEYEMAEALELERQE